MYKEYHETLWYSKNKHDNEIILRLKQIKNLVPHI